jgi:gamma-glutamyltranspeptidase/glutathione hydrolase
MMKWKTALLSAALLSIFFTPVSQAQIAAGIRYDTSYPIISPVYGKQGMVVSEQALASQAGLEILQRGGNAIDAAIATGFALAVVLPNAGNIGGGGFMLVHDSRSGKQVALDFRELAPRAARRDLYLDAQSNVIPEKSTYSHQAVGIPGTVAGLELAHKRFGSLPWQQLLAPAIQLAEKRFHSQSASGQSADRRSRASGTLACQSCYFFRNGHPLQSGDL